MWLKRFVYQAEELGAEAGSAAGASNSAGESGDAGMGGSDSSVNWEGMDASFDEEDVVEGDLAFEDGGSENPPDSPPAPTAAPASAVPAAAPAAASPPVVPTAPAVAPQPSQPTPPPQTQVQPQAAEPQVAPEVYQNWRSTRLGELEKHYTFSEDESAALLTEPELVLPKLAAKVHMEVLENSMRAMQAMVPVMMEQVTRNTTVETQAKGVFFSVNPDLSDPSYTQAIHQLGTAYRQMNQTAGPEEASRAIGNLVRAALNMQPAAAHQGSPGVTPAPVAPAPFAPVRGGGGGNRPAPAGNIFEQFASEILAEEDNY